MVPGIGDIEALLEAIPDGVRIQFPPLDIRHIGPEAAIGDMRFTQEEIDAAYGEHKKKSGRIPA